MLGAPRRETCLLLERATFWADLWRLSPDMWRNSKDEQALMLGTAPEESDDTLVGITHDVR